VELVGRDTQLQTVEQALEDVRGGTSRVLVVVAEPGVGKTALLEAAAERARAAGLLTLEGRAAEHERDVPFALAVAALDDHVSTLHPRRVETLGPILGAVLPAAANGYEPPPPDAAAAPERFRYHRALRSLVELLGRERPVALLLDDLHWADAASVEFVQHLVRRPPRSPHLLMLALRRPSVLMDTVAPSAQHEYVFLEPLNHDDSLALLQDVPDPSLRERIAREARGNPLFLGQLTRFAGLTDEAPPPCLLAAVGREIAALPPVTRALLDGAAVAGDPFDPELAAVAAEIADEDVAAPLDELVAAALVHATGTGRAFAFRHPLVRQAVYGATPPAWRLGAHERLATALAERGMGPGVRAHHVEAFARQGDTAAIALLSEAAAAAAETAPSTSARWYASARRLVPDTDAARRLELRAAEGLALAAAGRLHAGREVIVEVLDGLPPEPTPQRLALVAACAGMEELMGRPSDARRRLLIAYATAPAAQQPVLALQLASVASCYGSPRQLREWGERARTAPELLGAAEAFIAVGALWEGDADAAHTARARSAAHLRAAGEPSLEALLSLGMAELLIERYADACATATRGLEVVQRTGHAQLLVPLSCVAAQTLTERLDLDAAARYADDAAESARLQDMPHLQELVLLTRLPLHELRGEWSDVAQALEAVAELLPRLPDGFAVRALRATVATLHAERDPERCIAELEPLLEPDAIQTSRLLLVLVRCALALGRLDDAERWARRCTEYASTLRLPASAARGAIARAEVLLACDEVAEAVILAHGAIATAADAGARRDEAVARLVAGRALAAAGESDRAKATLREVAEDARRGGAHALVGDAARELRRLGTRIPGPNAATTRSGPEALSDRERDISELVAQGRSNKEVAAELFLSEKTIESTLTRIYAKLGVRSRVELTRRLIPV
jgi:DNA-binding NarL/FixJ family response regulator